jgi:Dolichyl-phosphate-mannose-protein mannosyltransferase
VTRLSRSEAIAWAAAVLLGALCLPAIWWEPLHLDERVMLELSRGSLPEIVRNVFIDRGGAPAQFLIERVTLDWPGGLVGLRGPSLAFYLLALPCAGLLARELAGRVEALAVPLLLALAPLAVATATFARMYALFLLLVIVTSLVSIRAGHTGLRAWWVAAGALAAALAYVHPIAPLYAVPAFASGLAVRPGSLRDGLREARIGLLAAAIVALPYAYALAVLRARYNVGEAGRLSTTAGRTVIEEALRALSPAGTIGLATFCLLAVAGVVQLSREQPRVAVLLSIWVMLPIVFFTIVPAETRFFGRYALPALPAFLVLVAAGCRLIGNRAPFVLALIAVALVLEGITAADRMRSLYDLDLRGLPAVPANTVLFSSTGSPRSDRPPELLDDLVDLEASVPDRVEELPAIDPRYETALVAKGARNVRVFLARGNRRRGQWIFRGSPRRVVAAERRLRAVDELATIRVGDQLLVVTTRRPLDARGLVALGASVRGLWGITTPNDRWPRTLAVIDRTALG